MSTNLHKCGRALCPNIEIIPNQNKKCGKCGAIRYCSKECQVKD